MQLVTHGLSPNSINVISECTRSTVCSLRPKKQHESGLLIMAPLMIDAASTSCRRTKRKSLAHSAKREVINDTFTYTSNLLENVRLVANQMCSDSIQYCKRKLKAVISWINGTYTQKKKLGVAKSELYNLLQLVISDLVNNVVSALIDQEQSESSLALIVIAADLHLSLLQEQILVDPKATSPRKSTSFIILKDCSGVYANHTEKMFKQLVKKRIDQITAVQISQIVPGDKSTWDGKIRDQCQWSDSFTGEIFVDVEETGDIFGYQEKKLIQLENRVEKARSRYIETVRAKFTSSLNDPLRAAARWKSFSMLLPSNKF